jgi:hypothetical protein
VKNRDIDDFIRSFSAIYPDVEIWQLKVKYPMDDDGIWYFKLNGVEFQLESSSGNFPFIVESNLDYESETVSEPVRLLSILINGLGLAHDENTGHQ